MFSKINWKVSLIILGIIGVYYFYSVNFSTPKGPLTVSADSVVFKHGCAKPESSCLKINLAFPSIAELPSKLSKKIYSDYLQMLEDSAGASTINEFKSRLVDLSFRYDSTYMDFSREFPDESYISWYLNINYEVLRNDGNVLTLCYLYSDYMGGAHGMQSYHYQNLDLKKSESIELADVFVSLDEFYPVAQRAFEVKFIGNKPGESPVIWFPNGQFVLPREFGFGSKGLILHYNVYEIASFDQGDILLEIPYSDLQNTLKQRWQYLADKSK